MSELNWYKTKKVIQVLIEEIAEIRNVECWERKTKVSGSWLYHSTKRNFNKTPGKILREIRFEKIVQLIDENMDVTSREVSLKIGLTNKRHYNHSDALYKFLTRHYGLNFTALKKSIIKNELQLHCIWLNGGWKKRRNDKIGDSKKK